jgi:hypothetical protein
MSLSHSYRQSMAHGERCVSAAFNRLVAIALKYGSAFGCVGKRARATSQLDRTATSAFPCTTPPVLRVAQLVWLT